MTGGSTRRVWVTRALPGAEETAARLRAQGHEPLVAPVLEVRRTSLATPELAGVGALAFTSANGVRAFAQVCARRDLPVFAVGDATAAAAAQAGFAAVASAEGDVAALARLLAERLGGSQVHVLHPCAVERAGDLAGGLAQAGVTVLSAPLYETLGVAALPQAARTALHAATLDAIVVHSPRAGRVLAERLGAPGVRDRLARVALAGLSRACLAPLASLAFESQAIAAVPREDALLSLLSR